MYVGGREQTSFLDKWLVKKKRRIGPAEKQRLMLLQSKFV